MNNPDKPTFLDCYEKGFLIGFALAALSIASGFIYGICTCQLTGQGDNIFFALLGSAFVHILLTPFIIAVVLYLKPRIFQKITFKQTYKF